MTCLPPIAQNALFPPFRDAETTLKLHSWLHRTDRRGISWVSVSHKLKMGCGERRRLQPVADMRTLMLSVAFGEVCRAVGNGGSNVSVKAKQRPPGATPDTA